MSERYVVRSVTGWSIIPTGETTGAKAPTIWTVHDSAIGYRQVDHTNGASYGERGERRARKVAAQMNAEDAAYLKEHA